MSGAFHNAHTIVGEGVIGNAPTMLRHYLLTAQVVLDANNHGNGMVWTKSASGTDLVWLNSASYNHGTVITFGPSGRKLVDLGASENGVLVAVGN